MTRPLLSPAKREDLFLLGQLIALWCGAFVLILVIFNLIPERVS